MTGSGSLHINCLRAGGSNPYLPRYKETAITNRLPCPWSVFKFLSLFQLWKYEQGEVTHIGRGHSAPITAICISPNESCIISVSADGAILCWKFPSRKAPEETEPEPESTKSGSIEIVPVGSPSKLTAD